MAANSTPGPLWDLAEARRDLGTARAEQGAGPEWCDQAIGELESFLRTHAEFFCDDFWDWARTRLPWPDSPRAIGPVILKAARSGWMEKTGGYRKSVRSNLSPKPVWRSLLFTGRSPA